MGGKQLFDPLLLQHATARGRKTRARDIELISPFGLDILGKTALHEGAEGGRSRRKRADAKALARHDQLFDAGGFGHDAEGQVDPQKPHETLVKSRELHRLALLLGIAFRHEDHAVQGPFDRIETPKPPRGFHQEMPEMIEKNARPKPAARDRRYRLRAGFGRRHQRAATPKHGLMDIGARGVEDAGRLDQIGQGRRGDHGARHRDQPMRPTPICHRRFPGIRSLGLAHARPSCCRPHHRAETVKDYKPLIRIFAASWLWGLQRSQGER